jgi:hypothetical protein
MNPRYWSDRFGSGWSLPPAPVKTLKAGEFKGGKAKRSAKSRCRHCGCRMSDGLVCTVASCTTNQKEGFNA